MAEADDDVVADVVAGAPVPTTCHHGGAELHEAERHVGAVEHVAMATRADSGIDILGVGPGLRAERNSREKDRGEDFFDSYSFKHNIRISNPYMVVF